MQSQQGQSLVNHPRLTEAFSHPEHNLNIIHWKDVRDLAPAQQQRFWSCLIYLFIMPPKYQDVNGKPLWKCQIHARDQKNKQRSYTPQCRYDQFIASHATCCEHHTNYFAYYHRHLISQYVLALNQADLALKNPDSQLAKKIKNKMRQIGLQRQYSAAISFYNQKVMKDFKQQLLEEEYTLQQLPWITPAYWNIFNYQRGFELPKFLTTQYPKVGQNGILDLFRKLKKCEFGQHNFKETWNEGTDDLSYFWRQRFTRIEPWQKQIIDGKGTRGMYMRMRQSLRNKIIGQLRDSEGKRKCTSNLIQLSKQQINFQFGGGRDLQYFTEAQSGNSTFIQSANFSIPYYQYAKALLTPFDDFCIPTDSNNSMNRDGFLCGNGSISLPHDLMHDSLGYPTSDGSFSIMSPMFMLYHGFVEYMTQQYLRLIQTYDKNQKLAYKSLKIFLDTPIPIQNYRFTEQQRKQLLELKNLIVQATKNQQIAEQRRLTARFKQLKRQIQREAPEKKYLQPGFGGFLAEFQQQNQDTFKTNGDYPIFQWTLTGADYDEFTYDQQSIIQGVHYSAIGTYKQFMLNDAQTGIRYSHELYSFYSKYENELKIPQQLIDNGYPFSFTFDIIEENKDKDPPIPDYLYKIQNDIEQSNIEAEMNAAMRISKVSGGIPMPILEPQVSQNIGNSMKFMFRNSIKRKLGPSKIEQQSSSLQLKQISNLDLMKKKREEFIKKLEQYSSLYCRVQHKSNLKNVTIMVSMQIKNIQQFNFSNSGQPSLSKLKDKIINSKGLIGSYPYTVFGKGELSATCPRCKPTQTGKFNVFKYLAGQFNFILLDLHINANIGILYDSRLLTKDQKQNIQNQTIRGYQKSFSQIVDVSHDYKGSGFKVQIISGAIQANFNVIFCQDLNDPNTLIKQSKDVSHQIRMTADSFDLANKTMFASLQSKRKSINTQIVFEQLTAPIQKKQVPKQLVYKTFKVTIIADFKPIRQDSDKKAKSGDVMIKSFEFSMKNFMIQAFYDIRIDKNYEILVIDSKFNKKMNIFF